MVRRKTHGTRPIWAAAERTRRRPKFLQLTSYLDRSILHGEATSSSPSHSFHPATTDHRERTKATIRSKGLEDRRR